MENRRCRKARKMAAVLITLILCFFHECHILDEEGRTTTGCHDVNFWTLRVPWSYPGGMFCVANKAKSNTTWSCAYNQQVWNKTGTSNKPNLAPTSRVIPTPPMLPTALSELRVTSADGPDR